MASNRDRVKIYTPADLGVSGVDLKAAATTKYATPVLSLADLVSYFLSLIVVNTGGGAAGTAKITAELYAGDGSTLLFTHDILTAIPTNTAGTTRAGVVFGRDFAGKKHGGGTIGVDIDILRLANRLKLIVEVEVANNGTTSAGSLHLLGQR